MTQQACIIQQLSVQFAFESLFENLNFQLPFGQCSSLIGRNGQGKSILMSLLTQSLLPTYATGFITWQTPFAYLPQMQRLNVTTIAEALDIQHLHLCFTRIEHGIADFKDYEIVENLWHLPSEWQTLLEHAGLPTNLDTIIYHLSEGQKTKLALCRLFLLKDHYLLLDEPSNHLDQNSQQWLIDKIQNHPAGCLVISHDRHLLDQIHHTFVLNNFGLTEYHCNYSQYKQLSDLELEALQYEIKQQKHDLVKLEKYKSTQLEKSAHKRKVFEKTKQLRKEPDKFILHAKKTQAQNAEARLNQQFLNQKSLKQQIMTEKKTLIEKIKPQSFSFDVAQVKNMEILRLKHINLPHCQLNPISLSLNSNEKIHLTGKNGIGKSILLKFIDQTSSSTPKIFKNVNSFYLDQNFSFLKMHLNAIENLRQFNTKLTDQEFRTQLGKIRLRTDKALMPISQLSGGEQLKIALLCIALSQNPIELLLLDEPENHLDIDSKILFASAIRSFTGAIILVSHDSYFVKECGTSEHFSLDDFKIA